MINKSFRRFKSHCLGKWRSIFTANHKAADSSPVVSLDPSRFSPFSRETTGDESDKAEQCIRKPFYFTTIIEWTSTSAIKNNISSPLILLITVVEFPGT